MKKFKRKRRLSSELNTRFGDPSISYPNEGSWSQSDHPSSSVVLTARDGHKRDYSDPSRRSLVTGTMSSQNRGSRACGHEVSLQDSTQLHSTIPKGYYDDRICHRAERTRSADAQGFDNTRHRYSRGHDALTDDESCDEEDEGRDTFNSGRATMGYNEFHSRETKHNSAGDDRDSFFDRLPRSPPLSVTSCMRRVSMQSATTEGSSSVTGTTSSRHTSYTGGSSVSAPSRPPDTPRYAFTSMHTRLSEKRAISRLRYRESEPAVRQEMVPSYDELYG